MSNVDPNVKPACSYSEGAVDVQKLALTPTTDQKTAELSQKRVYEVFCDVMNANTRPVEIILKSRMNTRSNDEIGEGKESSETVKEHIDRITQVCVQYLAPPKTDGSGAPEKIPTDAAIEVIRACVDGIERIGGLNGPYPVVTQTITSVLSAVVFQAVPSIRSSPVYVNLPLRIIKICQAYLDRVDPRQAPSSAGVPQTNPPKPPPSREKIRELDSETLNSLIHIVLETARHARMVPADRKLSSTRETTPCVEPKKEEDIRPVPRSLGDIAVRKTAELLDRLGQHIATFDTPLDIARAKMGTVLLGASLYCALSMKEIRNMVKLTIFLLRNTPREWDVLFISLCTIVSFWVKPDRQMSGPQNPTPGTPDGTPERRIPSTSSEMFFDILVEHLKLYILPRNTSTSVERCMQLMCSIFFGSQTLESISNPGVITFQYYLFSRIICSTVNCISIGRGPCIHLNVRRTIMHIVWASFTDTRIPCKERILCIERSKLMEEALHAKIKATSNTLMLSIYSWAHMIRQVCDNPGTLTRHELDTMVEESTLYLSQLLERLNEVPRAQDPKPIETSHVVFGEIIQSILSFKWEDTPNRTNLSIKVARGETVARIIQLILSIRSNGPAGETWVAILLNNDISQTKTPAELHQMIEFWNSIITYDENMSKDKTRAYDGKTFGARHAVLRVTPSIVYNRRVKHPEAKRRTEKVQFPFPDAHWGYILAASLFSRISLISRSKTRCAQMYVRTSPSLGYACIQSIRAIQFASQLGGSNQFMNEWIDFALHAIRCFVQSSIKGFNGAYTVAQPLSWSNVDRAFPQTDMKTSIQDNLFDRDSYNRTKLDVVPYTPDEIKGVQSCIQSMRESIRIAFESWSQNKNPTKTEHESVGIERVWKYMTLQYVLALGHIPRASFSRHPYLIRDAISLLDIALHVSVVSKYRAPIREIILCVGNISLSGCACSAAPLSDGTRTTCTSDDDFTQSTAWKRVIRNMIYIGTCRGALPLDSETQALCMDILVSTIGVRGINPSIQAGDCIQTSDPMRFGTTKLIDITQTVSDLWPGLDITDPCATVNTASHTPRPRINAKDVVIPIWKNWHDRSHRNASVGVICRLLETKQREPIHGYPTHKTRNAFMMALLVSFLREADVSNPAKQKVKETLNHLTDSNPNDCLPIVFGIDHDMTKMVPGYGPLRVDQLIELFARHHRDEVTNFTDAWVRVLGECTHLSTQLPVAFFTATRLILDPEVRKKIGSEAINRKFFGKWKLLKSSGRQFEAYVELPILKGENATAGWKPMIMTQQNVTSECLVSLLRDWIEYPELKSAVDVGQGSAPTSNVKSTIQTVNSELGGNCRPVDQAPIRFMMSGVHDMILLNNVRDRNADTDPNVPITTDTKQGRHRSPIPHESFPFPKMTLHYITQRVLNVMATPGSSGLSVLKNMAMNEARGDAQRLGALTLLVGYMRPSNIIKSETVKIVLDFVRTRAKRFRFKFAWCSAPKTSKSAVLQKIVRKLCKNVESVQGGRAHFVKETLQVISQTRYNSPESASVLYYAFVERSEWFRKNIPEISRRLYFSVVHILKTERVSYQPVGDIFIDALVKSLDVNESPIHECLSVVFARLLDTPGSNHVSNPTLKKHTKRARPAETQAWINRVILPFTRFMNRNLFSNAGVLSLIKATQYHKKNMAMLQDHHLEHKDHESLRCSKGTGSRKRIGAIQKDTRKKKKKKTRRSSKLPNAENPIQKASETKIDDSFRVQPLGELSISPEYTGHLKWIIRGNRWILATRLLVPLMDDPAMATTATSILDRYADWIAKICTVPALICSKMKLSDLQTTISIIRFIEKRIVSQCHNEMVQSGTVTPTDIVEYFITRLSENIKVPDTKKGNKILETQTLRYKNSHERMFASVQASRLACILWMTFIHNKHNTTQGSSHQQARNEKLDKAMYIIIFDIFRSTKQDTESRYTSYITKSFIKHVLSHGWVSIRIRKQVRDLIAEFMTPSTQPNTPLDEKNAACAWKNLIDCVSSISENAETPLGRIFEGGDPGLAAWILKHCPVYLIRKDQAFAHTIGTYTKSLIESTNASKDGNLTRFVLSAMPNPIQLGLRVLHNASNHPVATTNTMRSLLICVGRNVRAFFRNSRTPIWRYISNAIGIDWKAILVSESSNSTSYKSELNHRSIVPLLCYISWGVHPAWVALTRAWDTLESLVLRNSSIAEFIWSKMYIHHINILNPGDRDALQKSALELIELLGESTDAQVLFRSYIHAEGATKNLCRGPGNDRSDDRNDGVRTGSLRVITHYASLLRMESEVAQLMSRTADYMASDPLSLYRDEGTRARYQQMLLQSSVLYNRKNDQMHSILSLSNIFLEPHSPVHKAVAYMATGMNEEAIDVLSEYIIRTAKDGAKAPSGYGYVDPIESIAAMNLMRMMATKMGKFEVEASLARRLRRRTGREKTLNTDLDPVGMDWGVRSNLHDYKTNPRKRKLKYIYWKQHAGPKERKSDRKREYAGRIIGPQLLRWAQSFMRNMFIVAEYESQSCSAEAALLNMQYQVRRVLEKLEKFLIGGVPENRKLLKLDSFYANPGAIWFRLCMEKCTRDIRDLHICIQDTRKLRTDIKRDSVIAAFIERIGGCDPHRVYMDTDGYWPTVETARFVSMGRRVILNGILRNSRIFRITPFIRIKGQTLQSRAAGVLTDSVCIRGTSDKNQDLILALQCMNQMGMGYSAHSSFISSGTAFKQGSEIARLRALSIVRSSVCSGDILPSTLFDTICMVLGKLTTSVVRSTEVPPMTKASAESCVSTQIGLKTRVRYLYTCSESGIILFHDVPGMQMKKIGPSDLVVPSSEIFKGILDKRLDSADICMAISVLIRSAEASLGVLGSNEINGENGVGHLVLSAMQYAAIGLFCVGHATNRPITGAFPGNNILPPTPILQFTILRGLTWVHSMAFGNGKLEPGLQSCVTGVLRYVIIPMLDGTPADLLPVWGSRTSVMISILRGASDCTNTGQSQFSPLVRALWKVLELLTNRGPIVLQDHFPDLDRKNESNGTHTSENLSSQLDVILQPSKYECSAKSLHTMCENALLKASSNSDSVGCKERAAWVESALLSICGNLNLVSKCSQWHLDSKKAADASDLAARVVRESKGYSYIHMTAKKTLVRMIRSGKNTEMRIEDARKEILEIYQRFDEKRIDSVDKLLARYPGREFLLVLMIREKYVPENYLGVEGDIGSVVCLHKTIGEHPTPPTFWKAFAKMCTGLADFIKMMHHESEFKFMDEGVRAIHKAVQTRLDLPQDSEKRSPRDCIQIQTGRSQSERSVVYCTRFGKKYATPGDTICGFSNGRIGCKTDRMVCRKVHMKGSDGNDYISYSKWPHTIAPYTDEVKLLKVCDALSRIENLPGGAVSSMNIAIILLRSIIWPDSLFLGSYTGPPNTGIAHVHIIKTLKIILMCVRNHVGAYVAERRMVARILFHFVIRSKIAYRTDHAIDVTRSRRVPCFSFSSLNDLTKTMHVDMKPWLDTCTMRPKMNYATLSPVEKIQVDESINAVTCMLRRSWRLESYSDSKAHSDTNLPMFRSAVLECAGGNRLQAPGLGGGGMSCGVSNVIQRALESQKDNWWDADILDRRNVWGMRISYARDSRMLNTLTLDYMAHGAQMHSKQKRVDYNTRLEKSGLALLKYSLLDETEENAVSLPQFTRTVLGQNSEMGLFGCSEIAFEHRMVQMARSSGLQSALNFIDPFVDDNYDRSSELNREYGYSAAKSPSLFLNRKSGFVMWKNVHSAADDTGFLQYVQDAVGARRLDLFGTQIATHILKTVVARPFQFSAVHDVDMWMRAMNAQCSWGKPRRVSGWAKDVWSVRRTQVKCIRSRIVALFDQVDRNPKTHPEVRESMSKKSEAIPSIDPRMIVDIARTIVHP